MTLSWQQDYPAKGFARAITPAVEWTVFPQSERFHHPVRIAAAPLSARKALEEQGGSFLDNRSKRLKELQAAGRIWDRHRESQITNIGNTDLGSATSHGEARLAIEDMETAPADLPRVKAQIEAAGFKPYPGFEGWYKRETKSGAFDLHVNRTMVAINYQPNSGQYLHPIVHLYLSIEADGTYKGRLPLVWPKNIKMPMRAAVYAAIRMADRRLGDGKRRPSKPVA